MAHTKAGTEFRPTHLTAWSCGIEASTVTEGWVHTLSPVETGEQVCRGDTEGTPLIKPSWAEPQDAAPPSCQAPDPALPELRGTQIPTTGGPSLPQ